MLTSGPDGRIIVTVRHLNCMLISDLEADAVRTLEGLGFQSYVMPGYGADRTAISTT